MSNERTFAKPIEIARNATAFRLKTFENAASHGFAALYPVNRLSWNHQILQAHPRRHALYLHRMWRHELLSVGSYSYKNRGKCHLRRLQVECLDKVFCEDHQISVGCRGQIAPRNCWILRRQFLPAGCKMQ